MLSWHIKRITPDTRGECERERESGRKKAPFKPKRNKKHFENGITLVLFK